jgi:hypothetical protein
VAAIDQNHKLDGKVGNLVKYPSNAAIELTNINAAETPTDCLIVAQPFSSKMGLRKIPPPTPVSPDNSPITIPRATDNQFGTALTSWD